MRAMRTLEGGTLYELRPKRGVSTPEDIMSKYTFYPPTFSPLQMFPHPPVYESFNNYPSCRVSPPQWFYYKNKGLNEYFNNEYAEFPRIMSSNWGVNETRNNSFCCNCTMNSFQMTTGVNKRKNHAEKDQKRIKNLKRIESARAISENPMKDGILKGILNHETQIEKSQTAIKEMEEFAVVIWGFEGRGVIDQLEKQFVEWRLPKGGKLRCKSGWAFVPFPSKSLAHQGVQFIENTFQTRDGTKLSAIILHAKNDGIRKRKKPHRKIPRLHSREGSVSSEIELITLSSDSEKESEGELVICEGSDSGDHGLLCGIFGRTPPLEPCAAPQSPGPWHTPTCLNFTPLLPKKAFSFDDFSDLICISYENKNSFSFEEITDEEEEKKERSNLPIKKRKSWNEKSEGSLQSELSSPLSSMSSEPSGSIEILKCSQTPEIKTSEEKVVKCVNWEKFREPFERPFGGIRALDSASIEDFLYSSRLELAVEGEEGRNTRVAPQKSRRRRKELKAFGKRQKQPQIQFQMRIHKGPFV